MQDAGSKKEIGKYADESNWALIIKKITKIQ